MTQEQAYQRNKISCSLLRPLPTFTVLVHHRYTHNLRKSMEAKANEKEGILEKSAARARHS